MGISAAGSYAAWLLGLAVLLAMLLGSRASTPPLWHGGQLYAPQHELPGQVNRERVGDDNNGTPENDLEMEEEASVTTSSCPATPERAMQGRDDYFMRITRDPEGGPYLVEVLQEIVDVCGELWEADLTGLVGSLAVELCAIQGETVPGHMAARVLRGLLEPYRPFADGAPLPPYWSGWMTHAASQLRQHANFEPTCEPERGQEHEQEEVMMMQFEPGTVLQRLVRPRRPELWNEALRKLAALPRGPRSLAMDQVRTWLERQACRLGHPFVIHGMMLRDSHSALCLSPLTHDETRVGMDAAREAIAAADAYLQRYLDHQEGARQQLLVDAAVELASRYDELDDALVPLDGGERARRDFEEVQLQFLVNEQVRAALRGQSERGARVEQLQQALRAQIGSEARHLRRLCIALQGLLLMGEYEPEEAPASVDDWVSGMVDDLVLLANQEHGAASEEVHWLTELRRLRRWLADDRFLDEDPDARPSTAFTTGVSIPVNASEEIEGDNKPETHDGSPIDGADGKAEDLPEGPVEQRTHAQAGEGEAMSLVQKSRPPWGGRRARSRSRNARDRDQRTAEREAERSNAHRPWRTVRHERGTGSEAEPRSTRARDQAHERGACHPATVDTPMGRINLGVHAWHILLHMVDAMAPPEEAEYGVTSTQRTNIVNTLSDMTASERLHMLSSFMRTVAILLHDLADITDEVNGASTDEGADADTTGLMQRYMVEKPTGGAHEEGDVQQSRALRQGVPSLFGSAVELQVRAIISTLELAEKNSADVRASALLARLRTTFEKGFRHRDRLAEEVLMVESALVTFTQDHDARGLPEREATQQDMEFVNYWWRMLAAHLPVPAEACQEASQRSGAMSSWQLYVADRPGQREDGRVSAARSRSPLGGVARLACTQLDPDDVHAVEEERGLELLLDSLETKESQEGEVVDPCCRTQQALVERNRLERAAAEHRAAEQREFQEEMDKGTTVFQPMEDDVRVRISGTCVGRDGRHGTRHTMTWTMRPGEHVQLEMHLGTEKHMDAGNKKTGVAWPLASTAGHLATAIEVDEGLLSETEHTAGAQGSEGRELKGAERDRVVKRTDEMPEWSDLFG